MLFHLFVVDDEKLIHLADPQLRQIVIIVFVQVVRPSTVQNLAKQIIFQAKTMFTAGKTVGLAEWIIHDEKYRLRCYF